MTVFLDEIEVQERVDEGVTSARNRATHSGQQTLDTTTDTATRVAMTPAERTKLSGVATGATANSTDASLRARSSHTGTQTASTISDLQEVVEDFVGNMLVSGGSLTLAYDDASGKVTITGSGGDAETIRDTIGAALVGTSGVSVAVNDAADTITLTISTIAVSQVTNLQNLLDGKEPARTTVTQAAAQAGTETTVRGWTAERVRQTAVASTVAFGVRPTIYVNPDGTWPSRTLPTGYTGPVIWDAADYPTTVAVPSGMIDGDRLIRRKAA